MLCWYQALTSRQWFWEDLVSPVGITADASLVFFGSVALTTGRRHKLLVSCARCSISFCWCSFHQQWKIEVYQQAWALSASINYESTPICPVRNTKVGLVFFFLNMEKQIFLTLVWDEIMHLYIPCAPSACLPLGYPKSDGDSAQSFKPQSF